MRFHCPEAIENIRDVKAVRIIRPNSIKPLPSCNSFHSRRSNKQIQLKTFRIQNRIPYTVRTLRNKLSVLCGKDGYRIFLEDERLTVQVSLIRKNMLGDICRLLESIVPLNIVLCVGLLYNQYQGLERFSYGEMRKFTYEQLREETIL